MKYILLFIAFWPGILSQGIVVEPFDSLAKCEESIKTVWEVSKSYGAIGYKAECRILAIREA